MTTFADFDRRAALGFALKAGLSGSIAVSASAPAIAAAKPIRALAFDGFTLLDPRPVTQAVISEIPEHGASLATTWTAKLFSLSWLETSAGRYSGFAALADAALLHSARGLGLDMDATRRRALVDVFASLPTWPDAGDALERMRRAGLRLAFLSNLSVSMLVSNIRRNGLAGLMEPPLSTDAVRAFKPSPRAYGMGLRHFALSREQIGFVAFGGWDALGAKWFGYPTAWINRLAVTAETLEPAPDRTAPDLTAALELAGLAG